MTLLAIADDQPPQGRVVSHIVRLPSVDANDIRFNRLSTAQGLSQTRALQIVEDNQGFTWFGTQYGLNRYDGYNFRTFVNDPNDPNSLSGSVVSSLFKDRTGVLWIGCSEFLNRFDLATETFHRYPIPLVLHISEDSAGLLWLSTGQGLFSLDPGTAHIEKYVHDPHAPRTLSSNDVKSSLEDKAGNFWVITGEGLDEFDRRMGIVTLHVALKLTAREAGLYEDRLGVLWINYVTGNGIATFDRKTRTLTRYSFNFEEQPGTALTGVSAILEDKTGDLWFATMNNGLLKLDPQRQQFVRYSNDQTDPESLPRDGILNLCQDRTGYIWAALGPSGLTRFDPEPPAFQKLPHNLGNPSSDSGPFISAMYEDRAGILWIGTREALNRLDRKTGEHKMYRLSTPGHPSPDVISIVEDRSGALWVGTFNGGLLRFDRASGRFKAYRHDPENPHSLSSDVVSRMLVDRDGTLWVATWDGLERFGPKTEQFTRYYFDPARKDILYLDLVQGPDGALWLGTHSSGLERFDSNGKFTAYERQPGNPNSLSDSRINSVHFDRSGMMWLGTQNGLDRFDPKTSSVVAYTKRDGLAGNVVGCVLEDSRGDLWMSTNEGVSQFNIASKTFTNYSTEDGLPGRDLTGWGACFKSSSGEMFFGGFSGGTAFHPENLDRTYRPSSMVLTDFRLFGKPVVIGPHSVLSNSISYTSSLTLSYKQNVFSLEFAAPNRTATTLYRYRLDGIDHQWNETAPDQHIVTYGALPPGDYVFRAQAGRHQSDWRDATVTLKIRILAPWWETLWFRALCLAIAVLVLWWSLRHRIREAQRQERKLRDVIETIPTFAWTAQPDGFVDFVNRHWQKYTGLSAEQTAGSGWEAVVYPADLKRQVEKWQASLATGELFENEVRYRGIADGQYRWFLARAVPLRDARGKILKWYGISTDIEDRKRSELERETLRSDLAHVNRVSMLGELAASLSHELRQPIAATILSADTCISWLKREKPDLKEACDTAKNIRKAGLRASQIIDRLRSLYKKAPPRRELVAVNDIIREMVELLRAEANQYAVSIRTDLVADVLKITADRVQLQQVFMNLMLNAIEAMRETGGVLTVKTTAGRDGQLLISVSDTGVGLPEEKSEEIFDAFFTTKPQGSGMGLSITRSIVESHGGHVWATANNGRGATFHFTLPTTADILRVSGTGT